MQQPSNGACQCFLCMLYITVQFQFSSAARTFSIQYGVDADGARIGFAQALAGRNDTDIASNSSIDLPPVSRGLSNSSLTRLPLNVRTFNEFLTESQIYLRWDTNQLIEDQGHWSVRDFLSFTLPQSQIAEITGLNIRLGPPPALRFEHVEVIGPAQKCVELKNFYTEDLQQGDYFIDDYQAETDIRGKVYSRFAGFRGTEMISFGPKWASREFKVHPTTQSIVKMDWEIDPTWRVNSVVTKLECSAEATVEDMANVMLRRERYFFRSKNGRRPDSFKSAMAKIMALPRLQVMNAYDAGLFPLVGPPPPMYAFLEEEAVTRATLLAAEDFQRPSSLLEGEATSQAIPMIAKDFERFCKPQGFIPWEPWRNSKGREEEFKGKNLEAALVDRFSIKTSDMKKVKGLELMYDIPQPRTKPSRAREAKADQPDAQKHDSRPPSLVFVTLLLGVDVPRLCQLVPVDAGSLVAGDIYYVASEWARVVSETPSKALAADKQATIIDRHGVRFMDFVQDRQTLPRPDDGYTVTRDEYSMKVVSVPERGTRVKKIFCDGSATPEDMWGFIFPNVQKRFDALEQMPPPSFSDAMLNILRTEIGVLEALAAEVEVKRALYDEQIQEWVREKRERKSKRMKAVREQRALEQQAALESGIGNGVSSARTMQKPSDDRAKMDASAGEKKQTVERRPHLFARIGKGIWDTITFRKLRERLAIQGAKKKLEQQMWDSEKILQWIQATVQELERMPGSDARDQHFSSKWEEAVEHMPYYYHGEILQTVADALEQRKQELRD